MLLWNFVYVCILTRATIIICPSCSPFFQKYLNVKWNWSLTSESPMRIYDDDDFGCSLFAVATCTSSAQYTSCTISTGPVKSICIMPLYSAHSKNDLIYFKLFVPSGFCGAFTVAAILYQIIMNNYLNKCFCLNECFIVADVYFDCKSSSNDFVCACVRVLATFYVILLSSICKRTTQIMREVTE